jgi:phospholipid/cholesterol/gamma-HCH transport system substrate-binding protein
VKRAIRTHAGDFVAIIVLLLLSIAVSGYILVHERLHFPLLQSTPIKMYADLSTAQAFTPGQGQSVRVSGVQIGEIGAVKLKNGTGLIEMDIDPKYKNLIHTDASALARPRTGLQDMFLELNPGTTHAPMAKDGFTIPVSQTLPEVNLDEFEGALDADTRAYLNLLINGAGPALRLNGGKEIAGLLERFLPTHRDLARLNQAVAVRGTNLRRLINSLQRLNTSLAGKQSQVVQLIDSSAKVFRAFASEDTNVSRAIGDLPATLRQTTQTLGKVQTFANLLGPTATSLLPAAGAIPAANRALSQLAVPSTPILRDQIRPFIRAARPLVRNLRPAAVNLAKATPDIGRVFVVLNHLFNMLGYNSQPAGYHGYLWWLAWQDHEARTVFSIQDPNGTFRPLFIQVSCAQLQHSIEAIPVVGPAVVSTLNLAPVQSICSSLGAGPSADSTAAKAGKGSTATGGRSRTAASSQSTSSSAAAAGATSTGSSSTSSSTTSTTSSSSGVASTLASLGSLAKAAAGGSR